jgi:hypothetical protein
LLDLMSEGGVDLKTSKSRLRQTDRMCDMGFLPDEAHPQRAAYRAADAVLSATMPKTPAS